MMASTSLLMIAPLPDGSLGTVADQQQLLRTYRGIQFDGPSVSFEDKDLVRSIRQEIDYNISLPIDGT